MPCLLTRAILIPPSTETPFGASKPLWPWLGPIRTGLQGTAQLEDAREWVYGGRRGLPAFSRGAWALGAAELPPFGAPGWSLPLSPGPHPRPTPASRREALGASSQGVAEVAGLGSGYQVGTAGATPARQGGAPSCTPRPLPLAGLPRGSREVLPKVTIPLAWSLPEPSVRLTVLAAPAASDLFLIPRPTRGPEPCSAATSVRPGTLSPAQLLPPR